METLRIYEKSGKLWGHVLTATRIDRAKKKRRDRGEERELVFFAPISEIDT